MRKQGWNSPTLVLANAIWYLQRIRRRLESIPSENPISSSKIGESLALATRGRKRWLSRPCSFVRIRRLSWSRSRRRRQGSRIPPTETQEKERDRPGRSVVVWQSGGVNPGASRAPTAASHMAVNIHTVGDRWIAGPTTGGGGDRDGRRRFWAKGGGGGGA